MVCYLIWKVMAERYYYALFAYDVVEENLYIHNTAHKLNQRSFLHININFNFYNNSLLENIQFDSRHACLGLTTWSSIYYYDVIENRKWTGQHAVNRLAFCNYGGSTAAGNRGRVEQNSKIYCIWNAGLQCLSFQLKLNGLSSLLLDELSVCVWSLLLFTNVRFLLWFWVIPI